MFYYLLCILITAFILCYERVYLAHQYQRWKNLNSLVATQHKGKLKIWWFSFVILLKKYFQEIRKKIKNTNIRRIKKNKYEVTYEISGQTYKFITAPRRGPKKIHKIVNHTDDDVTNHIEPYLGPKNDCHNVDLDPDFFGYEKITIHFTNGGEVTFERGQIIKF